MNIEKNAFGELNWYFCTFKDLYEGRLTINVNKYNNIFFTSDTHFGQKRTFELSKRDNVFNSLTHMNNDIFKNINNKILTTHNSVFIHLGDRGSDDTDSGMDIRKTFSSINKTTSRSYLILGNYEVKEMEELNISFSDYKKKLMIEEGWTDVFEHVAFLKSPFKIDNGFNPYYCLIHDPLEFISMTEYWNKTFLEPSNQYKCLFGHIHGRQMVKKFGIDVGVDCHNFKPVTLQDCNFFINAIEEGFYDDSVFC